MIQISDGVVWNEAPDANNSEALQWINDNISALLSDDVAQRSASGLTQVEQEADVYGRPTITVYETESAVITRTNEYIHSDSGSWARKALRTSVSKKGGEQ